MEQFAPILVLGLGNDILTDDAVGLRVVEEVKRALGDRADVETRATTEMGLALLDEIAGRDAVVIVDAVRTGRQAPGHIFELTPEDLPAEITGAPHVLGVRETLALGQALGLEMPSVVRIIAVEVADAHTLGERLTPAVEAAVGDAVARVLAAVAAFRG